MTEAIKAWRFRGPRWLRNLLVVTTVLCLAAVPFAVTTALMTPMLSDSGQHIYVVMFLIYTAVLWPLLCVLGALLPWVLYRARPWLRLAPIVLAALYPLAWISIAFAVF